MAITRDLSNPGDPGRSVTIYRRGLGLNGRSYGISVDYIDSGVDTRRDCVQYTLNQVGTWPGDGNLPCQTVEIKRIAGGAAYRTRRYYQTGSGVSTNSTQRVKGQPLTQSIRAYKLRNQAVETLNTEYDIHRGAVVVKPWTRKIEVLHLMIPTILRSNPLGTVDGMIGKMNDNKFTIDGVEYGVNTLLFTMPTVNHQKTGDEITYHVTYHYLAWREKWQEEYLSEANSVDFRDMYSETKFTAPPYDG